jgi:hypothetical protein
MIVPALTTPVTERIHLGLARPDGVLIAPAVTDADGRPTYVRTYGSGVMLVIEARPGITPRPVGTQAFDPNGGQPDLQILVSSPLGDGSAAVCDKSRPNIGGVPGTDPLVFSDAPAVVDAVNDLGCRVDDGTGQPRGRAPIDACTIPHATSGVFEFVDPHSTVQYCLPIVPAWGFGSGDTVVAARVRDTSGTVGPAAEIRVRVEATPSPASTP